MNDTTALQEVQAARMTPQQMIEKKRKYMEVIQPFIDAKAQIYKESAGIELDMMTGKATCMLSESQNDAIKAIDEIIATIAVSMLRNLPIGK